MPSAPRFSDKYKLNIQLGFTVCVFGPLVAGAWTYVLHQRELDLVNNHRKIGCEIESVSEYKSKYYATLKCEDQVERGINVTSKAKPGDYRELYTSASNPNYFETDPPTEEWRGARHIARVAGITLVTLIAWGCLLGYRKARQDKLSELDTIEKGFGKFTLLLPLALPKRNGMFNVLRVRDASGKAGRFYATLEDERRLKEEKGVDFFTDGNSWYSLKYFEDYEFDKQ